MVIGEQAKNIKLCDFNHQLYGMGFNASATATFFLADLIQRSACTSCSIHMKDVVGPAIKTEWSDLSSRDLPCIFSFYLLYLIISAQEISMSPSSFRYYLTFLGIYAPSFLGHRRDLNVSCWQCTDCPSWQQVE